MFKILFDVIFRSAYSQSLLKDLPLATTHVAVTVCMCVCVSHIISIFGKAINILLMFLLTPLMNVFCMQTILLLMSALDLRRFLQDNLNM